MQSEVNMLIADKATGLPLMTSKIINNNTKFPSFTACINRF